ncbi:outer membrane beta-barrel domain-containing protein [Caldimonas thermodepolymerans]|jgi:outer membrane beta-barrel protein|uniref:Outer membrane beta-barrel domain-containing protein n=1 Tax=Caldimonas thermodepolymerans TaxID=215580 RepID=A0A2S5T5S8_9BURK|nr:outer membrane beta-barrel domain-containing protein [Caldimonas thermodepolymerans]PPE70289.1 outer membrane beta-barrel domain-containing protein [Caldimonas thermodepolymerans]QPC30199.1 outer membrane beta-barrel domain-containing protein [Caldimonas thermodepolymerans]RDI00583.1 outer membrane beta-barrel protein [Caldimonas thermodepolymerans]TCP07138.1 outer membrane beta-barrel protein [Caldimonas thermodepolymerans]UZG42956.1 outer membrane beta-barrel domain-containing protein [Ca
MQFKPSILALSASAALAMPLCAAAQQEPSPPATEQVVVPEIDRRDVRLPRIPSNDFEAGVFTGIYATESFGSSVVAGVRLGYHVTEDFFVEAAYARTRVSDEAFRRILPGGVFTDEKETLSYYNVSVGYNLLPGEVFLGARRAKASALYLIAGIGSTKLADQSNQTINVGFGGRVFLADWAAVQVDMRDHMFSYDLLGERKRTHNLEFTLGLSFFF